MISFSRSGTPSISLIFRFWSSNGTPTKQVPSPSDQAMISICWRARPASSSGESAPSISTAIASGASARKRPLVAMRPNSASTARSSITTSCHGCWLRELGAHLAASTIFVTTSPGTGSGLNLRTVNLVFKHSYTSTGFPPAYIFDYADYAVSASIASLALSNSHLPFSTTPMTRRIRQGLRAPNVI